MNRELNSNNEIKRGVFSDIYHQLFNMNELEVDVVAYASSLLDVGEFQLFQLAHIEWFGVEGDIKELERYFFSYLTGYNMPHWARHFARHVISLEKEDRLKPLSIEYHRFDSFGVTPSPNNSRLSTVIGVLVFLVTTIGVSMYIIMEYIHLAGIW